MPVLSGVERLREGCRGTHSDRPPRLRLSKAAGVAPLASVADVRDRSMNVRVADKTVIPCSVVDFISGAGLEWYGALSNGNSPKLNGAVA